MSEEIPKSGPLRLSDGSLMMPYHHENGSSVYMENELVQDAPKLLMPAPAGDFHFGGHVSLKQNAIANWAGQGAAGKTFTGRSRKVLFKDFILPWQGDGLTKRRSAPLNNEYKMLFCLAALAL